MAKEKQRRLASEYGLSIVSAIMKDVIVERRLPHENSWLSFDESHV